MGAIFLTHTVHYFPQNNPFASFFAICCIVAIWNYADRSMK